ncbi:MAG: ParA family protein [Actinomycetota bacterium]
MHERLDVVAIANLIAITNGKGGVYKSSIAANVAGIAALSGWRVLAVDFDPQANLGLDLGVGEQTDHGRGLLDALIDGKTPHVIESIRPGLDHIPSGEAFDRASGSLAAMLVAGQVNEAFGAVENALTEIASSYNLVIADTPPGDSGVLRSVYTAARWLVVPTRADRGSREGIDRVARGMVAVESFNPTLDLLGAVLTGIRRGATAQARRTRDRLAADLGDLAPVFETVVHDVGIAAEHTREAGQLVHEYEAAAVSGSSTGTEGLATDYQSLTDEILSAFTAGGTAR